MLQNKVVSFVFKLVICYVHELFQLSIHDSYTEFSSKVFYSKYNSYYFPDFQKNPLFLQTKK